MKFVSAWTALLLPGCAGAPCSPQWAVTCAAQAAAGCADIVGEFSQDRERHVEGFRLRCGFTARRSR